MTIDTFKKLAALVEEVSIDTKKHMIDIMMSWDETGHVDNADDDQHFSAFTSGKWYYDDEITRTIARRADYLECSNGYGWMIFVGRYCDEGTLEDAFEAGFGWSLECSAEFGELTSAQLDVVEECGVELEFAGRCRQWNDEAAEADVDVDVAQPDGNLPDVAQPDGNLPHGNLPDVAQPDGNLPHGNLPDVAQPDGNLPHGNLPHACITAEARPPPLRGKLSEISFIIHHSSLENFNHGNRNFCLYVQWQSEN